MHTPDLVPGTKLRKQKQARLPNARARACMLRLRKSWEMLQQIIVRITLERRKEWTRTDQPGGGKHRKRKEGGEEGRYRRKGREVRLRAGDVFVVVLESERASVEWSRRFGEWSAHAEHNRRRSPEAPPHTTPQARTLSLSLCLSSRTVPRRRRQQGLPTLSLSLPPSL